MRGEASEAANLIDYLKGAAGDAWPAEYRGNAFIGDVGGNLVTNGSFETGAPAPNAPVLHWATGTRPNQVRWDSVEPGLAAALRPAPTCSSLVSTW